MRVDLDAGAFDLGELADLDMLAEQRGGFFDGFLDGAFVARGGEHIVDAVGVDLDGRGEHGVGEVDELRGLGHEVGLRVELDGIAGLAVGRVDDGGGDRAFLGLAAFTLAGGLDALGADDFLCAGDVAFGFGERLLDVHHACAGLFTNLLDQCCGNGCH